mgnify:FL=1
MKVILVLAFTVLMLASAVTFLMGVQWLLADQEYAPQQDAAASLATAYLLASFICMWLASKIGVTYDRREREDYAARQREQGGKEWWRAPRD